jgi:ppGpp synthetase/RelA/SpoT-type nucleotidyltranferase
MTTRSVEDTLREEYSDLLPDIRRTVGELDARARYAMMPIALGLKLRHEQIVVRSRVKDCESAIGALRRRQEGKLFDQAAPEKYYLKNLPDLAGVRILVFPRQHVDNVKTAMHSAFPSWQADHILDEDGEQVLAWKHNGFCTGSHRVRCEYQIVPMLVGLFWEVEHAAIYKPDRQLMGVSREPLMRERTQVVLAALKDFEEEFVRQVSEAARG